MTTTDRVETYCEMQRQRFGRKEVLISRDLVKLNIRKEERTGKLNMGLAQFKI